MADAQKLKATVRETVGSRSARKLRGEGFIPASLQTEGDKPHVNLAISEYDFQSARRHHVHLYDLDINGSLESAVVRELQWDSMGNSLNHVEFKRVQKGVATETEVELEFVGHPKAGTVNHLVTHITISSIPSKIPDSILVKVGELEIGDHVKAKDLDMPEGVSLAIEPDVEIAVCAAEKIVEETTDEVDEDLGLDDTATPEEPAS